MDKQDFNQQLRAWRRYLHAHPETAFEEKGTADFVARALRDMGLEVCMGLGGTGVVATLRAGAGSRAIGLRADMDAINMPEPGDLPYRSQNPGKMHACGHDGHVATLMGAAALLAAEPDFSGAVRFIFQPAEEPGAGARAMLADGLLERFPIDEIYGLHNMPQYPEGVISSRVGPLMASEDNFMITIHGRGAHASAPHLALDPLVVAAEIILALQTVVARSLDPQEAAVVSCTELLTDGAHNAIPSTVVIKGDTRSYSPRVQGLIEERMRDICQSICRAHGAECDFSYTHEFAPTINEAACTKAAMTAARQVVGEEMVEDDCPPIMASEDFGLFLDRIPGCFLFLGGKKPGESPVIPLHNSGYDYNDDILETGARFLARLAKERLGCR